VRLEIEPVFITSRIANVINTPQAALADALKRWWANWTHAREGAMDRWERVLCRRTARQYGAGEEVSLHQLTCLLCATVLGSDAPATADPRLLLQPDGAAVDPQAFLAALSTHAAVEPLRSRPTLLAFLMEADSSGLQSVRRGVRVRST
jgi:hypothetical protein